MEKFTLNMVGFGFPDHYLNTSILQRVIIKKKGDIWRKGTGETYKENIARLPIEIKYEDGFCIGVDKIIEMFNNSENLFEVFTSCNYLELQIVISCGDDVRIPHIHIKKEQMDFLSNIKADIDIQIS